MPKPKKSSNLTDKQKRFCDEYIVCLNATQAAIRAGYSQASAAVIGHENLRKPNIRAFLDAKLEGLSLTAEETLKGLSDIARSSINDYLVVREEVITPRVVMHVSDKIKMIEDEIEDAEKYYLRAKEVVAFTEKQEEAHTANINGKKLQIIELQIMLERNPAATVVEFGAPQVVKAAGLDLAKIAEDKNAGRIKSFQHTEFGPKVEMYAADAAMRDLAKVHGLFEKDNKQKTDLPKAIEVIIVPPKNEEE